MTDHPRWLVTRHFLKLSMTTLLAGGVAAAVTAWMVTLGQSGPALLAFFAGALGSAPALGLLAASRETESARRFPRVWRTGWRPPRDRRRDLHLLEVWRAAEETLAAVEHGGRAFGPYVLRAQGSVTELLGRADAVVAHRLSLQPLLETRPDDERAVEAAGLRLSGASGGHRDALAGSVAALRARETHREEARLALQGCDDDLTAIRAALIGLRARVDAVVIRDAAGDEALGHGVAHLIQDLNDRATALEAACTELHPQE